MTVSCQGLGSAVPCPRYGFSWRSVLAAIACYGKHTMVQCTADLWHRVKRYCAIARALKVPPILGPPGWEGITFLHSGSQQIDSSQVKHSLTVLLVFHFSFMMLLILHIFLYIAFWNIWNATQCIIVPWSFWSHHFHKYTIGDGKAKKKFLFRVSVSSWRNSISIEI